MTTETVNYHIDDQDCEISSDLSFYEKDRIDGQVTFQTLSKILRFQYGVIQISTR